MNIPFFNRNRETKTLSREALTEDKDKNGIPDFLQREHFDSVTSSQKEFIKWESDVKEEIEEYIYGLKGYDIDPTTNKWKPVSPPLINDAGINTIKTLLRGVINKHAINTSLSEEDANKIILYQVLALKRNLALRRKIYKIDIADLDPIVFGFDNLASLVLARSIGDGQRIHNDNRLSLNYTGQASGKTI